MAIIPTLKQHRITFECIAHSPEILLECPACVGQGAHQQYGRLYFNTAKRVGICQRCGWKGKEQQLLTLLDIRASVSVDVPEERPVVQKRRISPFPVEAIPASQSREVWQYLCTPPPAGRGYSRKTAAWVMEHFACFYCPDGFYARRIVIPVCNRHGEYRTFVTRTIDAGVDPKYRYPSGNSISYQLYNLHFVRQTSTVILVEGVFDAVHCFPHAVALFGKQVSDAQIRQLQLHGIQRIFLMLDAEAHQKTPEKYEQTVARLRRHFFTFPIKLPHDTPTEYAVEELQVMCREAV